MTERQVAVRTEETHAKSESVEAVNKREKITKTRPDTTEALVSIFERHRPKS